MRHAQSLISHAYINSGSRPCPHIAKRRSTVFKFIHGETTCQGRTLAVCGFFPLNRAASVEVAKLIRTYGGEPLTAPAMREISLESNQPILEFAEALMRGAFDLVIFTTGVGVRTLVKNCLRTL